MKRGEVWVVRRGDAEHLVVIVGHGTLSSARAGVLSVPLSSARSSTLIEPIVYVKGDPVGVALTPRVGEVSKVHLAEYRGVLDPQSIGTLDVALRAVLDL